MLKQAVPHGHPVDVQLRDTLNFETAFRIWVMLPEMSSRKSNVTLLLLSLANSLEGRGGSTEMRDAKPQLYSVAHSFDSFRSTGLGHGRRQPSQA